ncbi:RNA-directed DNA polymerase, eukaryota [Tanacetum coccineum]
MNLTMNWKLLIDRFYAKLSTWKVNLLSNKERLTLIKVVLGCLGIYYLPIFKAPKSILKILERIRVSFFWGGSQNTKKLAWLKWPNVLAPLDKGGLDIVDIASDGNVCVWSLANDGVFSVGATCHLIDDRFQPSLDTLTIWDQTLPNKVNIFIWPLKLDGLPHRLNLLSRGMEILEISCPSCNGIVKSNHHIFFECDVVKDI